MSDSDEPKIIVDDDWKSQVQKEKEELSKDAGQSADEPANPQLPPASLEVLISTLSAQAMAALGFLPDPATGKPTVNRELAKHFIDILGVLEEKTSGNLSSEEQQLLTGSLHQLRMLFVNAPENTSNDDDSGVDTNDSSTTIELP